MSNEVETELLSCPFCGGNAAWAEGEQKTKYGNEQVYCSVCTATTMPGPKNEAAEDWNTRTSVDIRTQALELLSDEELKNRIAFHQNAAHVLKCELAKIWRMRVATGIATDEDKERAARISPSPERVQGVEK